ncbi:response regulator transcription factor [Paraburkholderia xenovorans]|uniref:response regulator transcription factor n=1 Tax=Paraburkholderia xenovorans TaxID=36873 RepID=UPI0038BC6DC3
MATLNKIVAVIDNDESIARAIKRLLRSVGIKAESFSSGEEFLGTLSSTSGWPACVILDYELPGIDGLELQRRVAPTGVPIIFVTGHDDPAVRETALASGAAGYLEKPFDGRILIKTIKIALGAT